MFLGRANKLTYENDSYVRRAKDLLCCGADDIERFWLIFKKLIDESDSGTLSLNKLYTKVLRINRSILGDTIFEIVDCGRDPHRCPSANPGAVVQIPKAGISNSSLVTQRRVERPRRDLSSPGHGVGYHTNV